MRVSIAVLCLSLAAAVFAEDSGPLRTHLIKACRYLDTRDRTCVVGGGCIQGPFQSQEVRYYLIQAVAECPALIRPIPIGAVGLMVVVTAVNPATDGYLVLDDGYTDRSTISATYTAGKTNSTAVTIKLGQNTGHVSPDLAIFASAGPVDVVVDFVGYLMP